MESTNSIPEGPVKEALGHMTILIMELQERVTNLDARLGTVERGGVMSKWNDNRTLAQRIGERIVMDLRENGVSEFGGDNVPQEQLFGRIASIAFDILEGR